MENKEYWLKKIKVVYAELVKRAVEPSFSFPNGGRVDRILRHFVTELSRIGGGEFNGCRMVDYCIFQVHKNRNADHQRALAPNAFGDTAFKKYLSMSSKEKTYAENCWLDEVGLNRSVLYGLVESRKSHPLAKYIYMPAEEQTKKRCINTDTGFAICFTSTLMWSPFSDTCSRRCRFADRCRAETEKKYPELYRIRIEEYGKEGI